MTAPIPIGSKVAASLGAALKEKRLTLAAAESCTGGLLSHLITNVPGSSDWFKGGVVAYDNAVKTKLLGVKASTIRARGAVSQGTAVEMARGVKIRLGSDVGVSITGIAGPGGARPGKPVGTVYVCVVLGRAKTVKKFQLKGGRAKIKTLSALKAARMLEGVVSHWETSEKLLRPRQKPRMRGPYSIGERRARRI